MVRLSCAWMFGLIAVASAHAELTQEEQEWNKVGVGSWVEHRMTSRFADGESEVTSKRTLSKKTATKLTFRTEGKMTKPSMKDLPAQETEEDVRFEKPGQGLNLHQKKLGEGEEEIEVAGKKIRCTWVEMELDFGMGQRMTTKTWCSDLVPGRIVKYVSKDSDTESVLMCTGFERK